MSEYREKVSFEFFKDIWTEHLASFDKKRKRFRGFSIYAIDGDDLELPASEDILENGYRGYWAKLETETHYPKMYTVQVVDILNGLITDFAQSPTKKEQIFARELAIKLEKKSITLYDRLHGSYRTVEAHMKQGSYFLMRLRSKNPKNPIEIESFCKGKKRSKWIDLRANRNDLKKDPHLPSFRVRLVKIRNPRSKEDIVLMTNLMEKQFSDAELGELYQRRWEIEGSFRDLTSTLKMSQWHTQKLNGILQEIYVLLWFVNQVRISLIGLLDIKNWLERSYCKANFKLCLQLVIDNLESLAQGETRKLTRELKYWIKRSIEKRQHLNRNYPRQIKRFGKKYKCASTVPKRP